MSYFCFFRKTILFSLIVLAMTCCGLPVVADETVSATGDANLWMRLSSDFTGWENNCF